MHRSPVNSLHKGQWRGALMLSVICAWISGCVNNREAGDLRRHWAHYDVAVMVYPCLPRWILHVYNDSYVYVITWWTLNIIIQTMELNRLRWNNMTQLLLSCVVRSIHIRSVYKQVFFQFALYPDCLCCWSAVQILSIWSSKAKMMKAINKEYILNASSEIPLCLLMWIRVAKRVSLAICHEMMVCYGFNAINVNNLWWLSLDKY